MAKRITKNHVRRLLRIRYEAASGNYVLTMSEQRVGFVVRYGVGKGRGNIGSRTAYGSRIRNDLFGSIQLEAGSERVLLDKISGPLAKAVNANFDKLSPELQAEFQAILTKEAEEKAQIAEWIKRNESAKQTA